MLLSEDRVKISDGISPYRQTVLSAHPGNPYWVDMPEKYQWGNELKKCAFLFPGQGSQAVGMGLDFYQEYDFVRELFDMAEEITRVNLSKLCFKGPMEDLTATVNLQPAVTAVNLAGLAALNREGLKADISAGHSLGEYSALSSAGVVSPEDTFRLVYKRGELMHRESQKQKGAMHAIIGLTLEAVEELIEVVDSSGVVSVANHNMETQIVTTGSPEAVKAVSDLAVTRGARAIPLKVSGAWHSSLISGAEKEFETFLGGIPFIAPESPVVHNATADVSSDPDEIKTILTKQLCSPVRWYDSVRKLMEERIEIFVEIGPGRVLSGLLKKILPKGYAFDLYTVNSMKTLEQFFKDIL